MFKEIKGDLDQSVGSGFECLPYAVHYTKKGFLENGQGRPHYWKKKT